MKQFIDKHSVALITFFLCLMFTQPVFGKVFINGNGSIWLVITAIVACLPLCYAVQLIPSKWGFAVVTLFLMMLCGTDMFLILAERDFALCANIMAALTAPPAESKNFQAHNTFYFLCTIPQMFWELFSLILRFRQKEKKYKRIATYTGISFIAAFCLSFIHPIRNLPPYNMLNEGSEALYKIYEKKTLIPKGENMTFGAVRQKIEGREIYVLGVGESQRADHWSINGYHRRTTPQLKTFKNLVSFDNYYSTSTLTMYSVPVMLTRATADDFNRNYTEKSIVEPYRECGFKTFVISTGKLLTYDRYLTRGVDSVFNIKNDTVAPYIIDSLSHIYNKTLFIVQLYQSHMYYENFAPRFNRWHPNHITEPESKSPDLFLNAYDNTILHGDEVLSNIIRVIDRPGACSTFLFASDHGEELSMHGQQRGMGLHPRIVEYNPAMFFWYSDKWENKHPEGASRINRLKHSPVNAEDFFYTACDMADISISKKYAHPEYSWLSGKYRFHKRRVLLPNGITVIDAAEKNFINQEKSVNQ